MAEAKDRLPFRLLNSALDLTSHALSAGTSIALDALRVEGRPNARPAPSDEGTSHPEGADETIAAADRAAADAAPGPSETATAKTALATALDDNARAALAQYKDDSSVTDGLAIEDDPSPVEPEEELGPKPFEPQVGP